jgi:hypothetical protein
MEDPANASGAREGIGAHRFFEAPVSASSQIILKTAKRMNRQDAKAEGFTINGATQKPSPDG